MTKVDDHFAAIVTQPATVDPRNPRVAYVGVASMEEALAGMVDGYQCCRFRGSIVALDTDTGRILWKTYTVPKIEGYSGAGAWGSMSAIDRERRMLYVATGNNYSVPAPVAACVNAAATAAAKQACLEKDNYFDSVLALDLRTGPGAKMSARIPVTTTEVIGDAGARRRVETDVMLDAIAGAIATGRLPPDDACGCAKIAAYEAELAGLTTDAAQAPPQ